MTPTQAIRVLWCIESLGSWTEMWCKSWVQWIVVHHFHGDASLPVVGEWWCITLVAVSGYISCCSDASLPKIGEWCMHHLSDSTTKIFIVMHHCQYYDEWSCIISATLRQYRVYWCITSTQLCITASQGDLHESWPCLPFKKFNFYYKSCRLVSYYNGNFISCLDITRAFSSMAVMARYA